MGNIDRIVRAIIAVALLAAYFTDMLSGVWTTVGLIVIIAFGFTSAVGFCPIYTVAGLSTKAKD